MRGQIARKIWSYLSWFLRFWWRSSRKNLCKKNLKLRLFFSGEGEKKLCKKWEVVLSSFLNLGKLNLCTIRRKLSCLWDENITNDWNRVYSKTDRKLVLQYLVQENGIITVQPKTASGGHNLRGRRSLHQQIPKLIEQRKIGTFLRKLWSHFSGGLRRVPDMVTCTRLRYHWEAFFRIEWALESSRS